MLVKFVDKSPILEIVEETGIIRDRNPDGQWGQLKRVVLSDKIKEINIQSHENINFKVILLEDLAYVYGHDSVLFRKQLIKFQLFHGFT